MIQLPLGMTGFIPAGNLKNPPPGLRPGTPLSLVQVTIGNTLCVQYNNYQIFDGEVFGSLHLNYPLSCAGARICKKI